MDSRRFRLTIINFSILFCTLAGSALWADQVTLKNGDRVTGKIVKKDGDSLTVKSDLMGDVTVKWENVTAVQSDDPLVVVLPEGKTVKGKLSTSADTVEIATESTTEKAPLPSVTVIRNAAEQQHYERFLKPRISDLWAGYIDFGLALARGNASTTSMTTAFNATRATKTDKTTLYLNQIYGKATVNGRTDTTAQAVRGGWGYNRNINKRLFVNAFNDYEYDRFQNLDLRFVLGGGVGYSVIKTDRSQLDLIGGLAYNREKFSYSVNNLGVSNVRNSAEAFWGDDWSYKLTGATSVKQAFRMFNNMTTSGEYRMNFDLGLATSIRKWLSWQITYSDRYLSNPALSRKKNDVLLSTGVRVSFAK